MVKNSPIDWWFITAIGLLLILFAAASGLIKNYYEGEEFLIYHYANNLPHDQAWQSFFQRFGRPVEAIFWTYQYKLFGFNPLLTHSFSFVLLLIIAILASICFLSVWPSGKRTKLLPYIFVGSLFINWVSTSSVLRQSYDNGRISLIPFFLAGIALQLWAASQRARWLILSLILFLISVLAYENVAFLFPALVLLALPLLPKRGSVRFGILLFLGLSGASGLILLISRWFYGSIARPVATPLLEFQISDLSVRLSESAPSIYLQFGRFYNFGALPVNFLIAIGLILTLLLSSLWIIRIYRDGSLIRETETKWRWMFIYLAALWFLIFGPLPYVLLGFEVVGRVYSSGVFGVFLLMFMLYASANKQLHRVVAVSLLVLFALIGLLMGWKESIYFNQREASINSFYRGLREAIPNIDVETEFIIINPPIGNQGCAASLEMLYNKRDLECVVLISNFEQNSVRRATELETSGDGVDGDNWIVVAVTDGEVFVVDELKPGDFDLLIAWENPEPIRTNMWRILSKNQPPSAFYLHLLERAKVLFDH